MVLSYTGSDVFAPLPVPLSLMILMRRSPPFRIPRTLLGPPFGAAWLFLSVALASVTAHAMEPLPPLERSDCRRVYFPLPAHLPGDTARAQQLLDSARQQAEQGADEAAFERLWQAHYADPSLAAARRMLALPRGRAALVDFVAPRHAPPALRWSRGRYLQAETPHFVIFSTATREQTAALAEDLERFYWIWTQVFFPLWQDREAIGGTFSGGAGLGTGNRRLQVILCRDRARYNRLLKPQVPGIEQSTGFYSDAMRATFVFAGPPHDPATRYHELTHQLIREATGSRLRGGRIAGDREDFWLVEGIAAYMESLRFAPTYALVGGWESPRLQYARHRWLVAGDTLRLEELVAEGRRSVQRRSDLPRWYSHVAAYTHWLLDHGDRSRQLAVFRRLAELYAIPAPALQTSSAELPISQASTAMLPFLRLDDQRLTPLDPQIPLARLCLARTEVTSRGLAQLGAQPELRWLDLSHLPIGNDVVRQLASQPQTLQQLSLEATAVDDGLADWLAQTDQLTELDLSLTAVTDRAVTRLAGELPLETLWLTGSRVGNGTLERAGEWEALEAIDVQRTAVEPAAVDRLRQLRPNLRINPLRLIAPSNP